MPVEEQLELEQILYSSTYWKKGKDTLRSMVGTNDEAVAQYNAQLHPAKTSLTLTEGQEEDNQAAPEEEIKDTLELSIWNAVHGIEEDDTMATTLKTRLTNAFTLLNVPAEDGDTSKKGKNHPKYFEMVCRLSKIALKNNLHELVREWLFDESNKIDEIAIAFEAVDRDRQMKERKRKVRTRTNKMKARVELHQKKIQNKQIEWEEEQNNLEDDVESVPFDPSTVSDIELDEDTIASDLAEEEELGK